MTRTYRHVSADAVADAFEFFAKHIREGHIMGCSTEWEPMRTARFTVVYAPGVEELEVPGVVPEDDE